MRIGLESEPLCTHFRKKELGDLTGDHLKNLTMDLPCESVVAVGQQDITIKGPYHELALEILDVRKAFWN